MVLEQLITVRWLKKGGHSFALGFLYSLIAMLTAKMIFPKSFGFASFAFASILLIPSLNKLLLQEEHMEIREKKYSISLLLKDHKEIFRIYLWLFLGIFFAFFIIAMLMQNQAQVFFRPQLSAAGINGLAYGDNMLINILINNLVVLGACLLLSLAYGAGAIFFLTWNASVWGVFFGYVFANSPAQDGNIFFQFLLYVIPFMPHMITEAVAYISASVAGGVISKATLKEKLYTKKFYHVLTDGLLLSLLGAVLIVIAAVVEVVVF